MRIFIIKSDYVLALYLADPCTIGHRESLNGTTVGGNVPITTAFIKLLYKTLFNGYCI